MTAPARRGPLRRSAHARRAQSLVEFALVAPLFITLVFSIVEAGLLLYVFNSAQHASTLAQETIAAEGSLATADLDAVDAVRATDFGHTGLIKITEYNVYMVTPGTSSRDTSSCSGAGCFMAYAPYGAPAAASNCRPSGPLGSPTTVTTSGGATVTAWGNWPPSARVTSVAGASYIELDVCYDYTPFGLNQQTFHLIAQRFFRLEPQSA